MIEYTGGLGITINDNDEIVNAGVRAIASGSANGTISVNTNGNTTNVAVTGLSDLAYISKPATGSNTVFLNSNGTWNEIPAATTEQLGGVKIGSGLNVDASGALNVKLSSVINSTATDYAATSYAVKQAYDLAASKTSNVGTVTSVTLTAGTGIAISDDGTAITSSGSRTISHATTPIGTTGVLGSTATNTYLTGIIVDNLGHVDSVTTATVTITDTKNTAGSTDSSEKLFLIGAESQATSATTYSNSKVFIQNNILYSNNKAVLTEHQDIPVTSVAGMAGGAVTLKTLNLFGKVDYNGSTNEVVKVSDLGLSKAMTFLGITTTQLEEGTTSPNVILTVNNTEVTATEGDVVIVEGTGDEYVWSQGVWQSLGYATNYALENHIHGNINSSGAVSTTATIADGNHLLITGSDNKIVASNITFGTATTTYLRNDGTWATLSTYSAGTGITLTDTTFSHTIPTNATAGTLGSSTARYYIKTITTDKFGHVTGVTTGNETVTNSDTKNTAGSTNSTSKLYLVGATSQTANAVTYSHSAVYATGGQLDANKVRIGEHVTLQYNTTTNALDFVFV